MSMKQYDEPIGPLRPLVDVLSMQGRCRRNGYIGPAPSTCLKPFSEAKAEFEANYVNTILRLCGGNISQAARIARRHRKDFCEVIQRTGIDPNVYRPKRKERKK